MGEWNLQGRGSRPAAVMKFTHEEKVSYKQRLFHRRCWYGVRLHDKPAYECGSDHSEKNGITPFPHLRFRHFRFFFFRLCFLPKLPIHIQWVGI